MQALPVLVQLMMSKLQQAQERDKLQVQLPLQQQEFLLLLHIKNEGLSNFQSTIQGCCYCEAGICNTRVVATNSIRTSTKKNFFGLIWVSIIYSSYYSLGDPTA